MKYLKMKGANMYKKIPLILIAMMFIASICFAKDMQATAKDRATEARESYALKYLMSKYEQIDNLKARIKKIEKEIQDFKEDEFISEGNEMLIIEDFKNGKKE